MFVHGSRWQWHSSAYRLAVTATVAPSDRPSPCLRSQASVLAILGMNTIDAELCSEDILNSCIISIKNPNNEFCIEIIRTMSSAKWKIFVATSTTSAATSRLCLVLRDSRVASPDTETLPYRTRKLEIDVYMLLSCITLFYFSTSFTTPSTLRCWQTQSSTVRLASTAGCLRHLRMKSSAVGKIHCGKHRIKRRFLLSNSTTQTSIRTFRKNSTSSTRISAASVDRRFSVIS